MSGQQAWYVVHTELNGEARAELNLRRQGYHTYLPRYLRSRRHARRTQLVPRPLFPRYLFVALDLARDRWRSIPSTFGVLQIVLAGERPAPVPVGIVEQIKARETDDGYVALGLPRGVALGSRVRIVDGVFADSKGIVERISDDRRVAVLLEMLCREVRVFLPSSSVSAS